ncbi:hypothetical protein QR680_002983 [Steinernema hermaphroditum]|uniref:Uncharacterized protein n=1 Tax=Steinernema hermaphroditum TaxID=289476 RepID=A0AA39H4Z2_9BILA|nr:hypothetical protein QR680_002983 [Steinernema hermaphroditum]
MQEDGDDRHIEAVVEPTRRPHYVRVLPDLPAHPPSVATNHEPHEDQQQAAPALHGSDDFDTSFDDQTLPEEQVEADETVHNGIYATPWRSDLEPVPATSQRRIPPTYDEYLNKRRAQIERVFQLNNESEPIVIPAPPKSKTNSNRCKCIAILILVIILIIIGVAVDRIVENSLRGVSTTASYRESSSFAYLRQDTSASSTLFVQHAGSPYSVSGIQASQLLLTTRPINALQITLSNPGRFVSVYVVANNKLTFIRQLSPAFPWESIDVDADGRITLFATDHKNGQLLVEQFQFELPS